MFTTKGTKDTKVRKQIVSEPFVIFVFFVVKFKLPVSALASP